MELSLPWKVAEESHLGDLAYSIVEASGNRVAVGFTKADADFVCHLVNREAEVLTMETVFDYFKRNGFAGLTSLPEREITGDVYDHFLNVLPPEYLRGGGFYVIERISGRVVSSYWKRGDRFFHRYIEVDGE